MEPLTWDECHISRIEDHRRAKATPEVHHPCLNDKKSIKVMRMRRGGLRFMFNKRIKGNLEVLGADFVINPAGPLLIEVWLISPGHLYNEVFFGNFMEAAEVFKATGHVLNNAISIEGE